MYAIFRDGGHQYRVEAGDRIRIQKRDGEAGDNVDFGEVLAVPGNIGTPTLAGASVSGKILGQIKGEKIYVEKFRRRKNYRRRNGHRQLLTEVEILEVKLP